MSETATATPIADVTLSALSADQASTVETRFVLPDIDEDIRADFAARGIDLANGDTLEQTQREAAAALLLRLIIRKDDEIARLTETMDLEIDLVRSHYARLIAKPKSDRAGFERHVHNLAEISATLKGFGKKKSASTPFGSFGIRQSSATVEVTDAAALLEHLKANDPAKVKVVATMPLNEAREYLSPTELAKTKMEPRWAELKATLSPDGELPPGVAKVPETTTAFAKPERPTFAMDGAR